MTDAMTNAQRLAASIHPSIGVLCRDGAPMFYICLTDPEVGVFTVEYTDPAELAAYLPDGGRLRVLADRMSVACGSACPDCGSRDTEDNGAAEYRCCACDHRWGNDVERYGY
jgi:hypothetical protein